MNYLLEADNITKDFTPSLSLNELFRFPLQRKPPVRALENVSFSLEKGKILCLLGPNGAGKTTLLKIISTLILPDRGSLTVNGYRLENDERKIKLSVGLVLEEERSFYGRLTGRQNLEFFASLYGIDYPDRKMTINRLLELFRVDFADARFDSYSTGMKRCFALMRSLVHNPELILLDEPTKSLDYTAAINLRNFVKKELVNKAGKTVIVATHNFEEARDFADLFLIIHKGRIMGLGTLEELRKKINQPAAALNEIFLRLTQKG